MQDAMRYEREQNHGCEGEQDQADEEHLSFSDIPPPYDDGLEFSSEPMPAAFSACLFLGAALVMGALLAIYFLVKVNR